MLSIDDFLPSEERCAEILRELRWADGVECVWCGSRDVVKNGGYMQFYQKYMCRGCGRSFNDKTRTIFEYSKMRWRSGSTSTGSCRRTSPSTGYRRSLAAGTST